MTSFYINADKMNMWEHQNCAEVLDFRDGCLLDHFLVYTKNGVAAVHEHYLNPNASNYRVDFARRGSDFFAQVEEHWEAFADAYDKEIGADE